MNHQQRKPTRPPTTTTAATEMPAIAPVERPLLFALVDAQLDPSALGAYPSTHLQSTPSSLAFSGHLAMQPFPFGWTFCPLVVQPVQVCSPPEGVVHVLQPAIGGLQSTANATAKAKVNPSNIRPGRLFVVRSARR